MDHSVSNYQVKNYIQEYKKVTKDAYLTLENRIFLLKFSAKIAKENKRKI